MVTNWSQDARSQCKIALAGTGLPGGGIGIIGFSHETCEAVAEFERTLIRERQREGIALAKQRGEFKHWYGS